MIFATAIVSYSVEELWSLGSCEVLTLAEDARARAIPGRYRTKHCHDCYHFTAQVPLHFFSSLLFASLDDRI